MGGKIQKALTYPDRGLRWHAPPEVEGFLLYILEEESESSAGEGDGEVHLVNFDVAEVDIGSAGVESRWCDWNGGLGTMRLVSDGGDAHFGGVCMV